MNAVAETAGEEFFIEEGKCAIEDCVPVSAGLEKDFKGICEAEIVLEGDERLEVDGYWGGVGRAGWDLACCLC